MDTDQEYTKFRERLSYICTTYRDRDAITYMLDSGGKKNYSFADVERKVHSWETAFPGFGLLRGDRAAIISPASPKVIIAMLALAQAGITAVMIDAALPAEEINRLLAFSDVRAVFTVNDLFRQLSAAEKQGIPVFDLDSCDENLSLFPQSGRTVRRGETEDRAADVIAVIYSSGTTSTMKGIMVTYQYGKRFRKYPLEIRFGNPISPGGKTEKEITEEIRDQILEMKECQGGEL